MGRELFVIEIMEPKGEGKFGSWEIFEARCSEGGALHLSEKLARRFPNAEFRTVRYVPQEGN
jgi:hypothetical protein